MRVVTAVVKPFVVDEVMAALVGAGASGVTLREVRGYGRQGGHLEVYRGVEYETDSLPKVRIDVLVGDAAVETILTAIVGAAATGQIGDGKVWVRPVEVAARIRTGERGEDAL